MGIKKAINMFAMRRLASAYGRIQRMAIEQSIWVKPYMVIMYLPLLLCLTYYRFYIGREAWDNLPTHIRNVY